MHHLSFRFVCTALLVALATACSNSPNSPTSPTAAQAASTSAYVAAQLDGTWTVTSIQPAGQSPQQRPANATYTITFADGRLSTRTDCNVCSGAFSLNGDTLSAGPTLACTRAACQSAPFEYAYTSILAGDSVVATSSSTLTLSSPRGSIQFVR